MAAKAHFLVGVVMCDAGCTILERSQSLFDVVANAGDDTHPRNYNTFHVYLVAYVCSVSESCLPR